MNNVGYSLPTVVLAFCLHDSHIGYIYTEKAKTN